MKKWLIFLIIIILVSGCARDSFNKPAPRQEIMQPSQEPSEPVKEPFFASRDEQASVEFIDSNYKSVIQKTLTGWFKTGQKADIVLSSFGFGKTGGPLMFHHPSNIATDGKKLVLADTRNNRVLVWNELPLSNKEPDLVLGQIDFNSNTPGLAADKMNWPVSVATDGKRVIVADTNNNRVLVWNEFPTKNGEPADIVLGEPDMITRADENVGLPKTKKDLLWPWAVWTNGEKLIVTSTMTSNVLIWNTFPTKNYQEADIILYAKDMFGTPRTIGSDGKRLVIGDHNARVNDAGGNFFWNEFPTSDDEPYDFFMTDPLDKGLLMWGASFTEDGRFMILGSNLYIWDSFPENGDDAPDITMRQGDSRISGSDGSGMTLAGERLFISMSNQNKVAVYNSIPSKNGQKPDYVIGAPDIYTNTLEKNFLITNPIIASNGKNLFVSSDFEGALYVWKNLPDESSAKPDIKYTDLGVAAWDNALYKDTFVIAGKEKIVAWTKLPLNGEMPDIKLGPDMGDVRFEEIKGVALDDKYFYISDNKKIYVWGGLPEKSRSQDYTINVGQTLARMSSDGKHLAVNGEHEVYVYSVDGIASNEGPVILKDMGDARLNLAQGVFIDGEHLFVSDTGFNRVLIWNKIPTKNDTPPDIVLGQKDFSGKFPSIGQDRMFMPAGLSFDGTYLWVGEFKFSGRILRYSVQ